MKKLTKTEKAKRGTLDNRHRETAPGTPLSTLPPVPGWLSDAGQAAFEIIAGDLLARGVLYGADLGVLSAFCSQYADYIEAAEEIRKNGIIYTDGNGQKRRNPAIMIKNAAYQSMMQGVKTLGIAPYFRSKIEAGEVHQADPREAAILRAVDANGLDDHEAEILQECVADPVSFAIRKSKARRPGDPGAMMTRDNVIASERWKLIEILGKEIRGY